MVSAWGEANGMVLGRHKVDEISNEITAIPRLLEALDLTVCIVNIAAMGCQTDIAEQIVEQGGDYVLSLKGNQGQLHEDFVEMFTYFEKIGFANIVVDYHKKVGKEHGRIELRECWTSNPHQWA